MIARLTALQYSISIHGIIVIGVIIILNFPKSNIENLEVPIYVLDQSSNQQMPVALKSVNTNLDKPIKTKAIFGTSRNSQVSKEGALDAKLGNTLAKEVDATTLTANDADSLPSPVEEFLVTQMPLVLNIVRPEYPIEARETKQEGSVVLDILIDTNGVVRDAVIIEGPLVFRGPALLAIKKFSFKPAMIENKKVAVRIRYTLKFRLE